MSQGQALVGVDDVKEVDGARGAAEIRNGPLWYQPIHGGRRRRRAATAGQQLCVQPLHQVSRLLARETDMERRYADGPHTYE